MFEETLRWYPPQIHYRHVFPFPREAIHSQQQQCDLTTRSSDLRMPIHQIEQGSLKSCLQSVCIWELANTVYCLLWSADFPIVSIHSQPSSHRHQNLRCARCTYVRTNQMRRFKIPNLLERAHIRNKQGCSKRIQEDCSRFRFSRVESQILIF